MALLRVVMLSVLCSLLLSLGAERVEAQASEFELTGLAPSPVTREMNRHLYARLEREPWRALAWDALFPGAGSAYTGLRVNAIVTLSLSVLGAGMWTAGALADDDTLWCFHSPHTSRQ